MEKVRNNFILVIMSGFLFVGLSGSYSADVDSPTQIANQMTIIASMSQQIQALTDQLSKLDEQINRAREQLDFDKRINDGTAKIPVVTDLRDLYKSVLDLQDGIVSTVEDVQALNNEINSYFSGGADFSIDPRYANIQLGKNTATIKLAKAKEMQMEAQKAREISEKLAGQPIGSMDDRERELMMIKSLVNILDVLTRMMEKTAAAMEGDAVQQLEANRQLQEEELARGEMFNQVNIWVQEIPSNIFYTPTGIFSEQGEIAKK